MTSERAFRNNTVMGRLSLLGLVLWSLPVRGQTVQWIRQFGTNNPDHGFAVAADSTGVYIAGRTFGTLPGQATTGPYDAFVRKYDPSGNELWTRQFGGPNFDVAYGLASDSTGVYVVGQIGSGALPGQTAVGGGDAFVRKYDASGNEVWTRQFGSTGSDFAQAVAVDSTGVYVAGRTFGTFPGQTSGGGIFEDAFIRKYDLNGNEQWTNQFGTALADQATGVAVNNTGVYVSGSTGAALPGQTFSGNTDAFLRRYDLNGTVLWTRQFGTAGGDSGQAVAANSSGVCITGFVSGALPGQTNVGFSDNFARLYDSSGNEVWTRQFGTINADQASAAGADASGFYVGGNVNGALPGQSNVGVEDLFVRNYTNAGVEQWTIQTGTDRRDEGWGLGLSGSSLYLGGDTFGSLQGQTTAGDYDPFVMKLVLPAASQLYSVDRDSSLLRELDPLTGATRSTRQITLAGRTVTGATGLATDPVSGNLFALLRITPFVESTPSVRELVTINPATGVATDIGAANNGAGLSFADLAFTSSGTLLATTGDGSTSPSSLFTLNKTTGAATFVRVLGNGDDGETIATNPGDGVLYHASGQNEAELNPPPPNFVFEKFDLASPTSPILPITLSGATIDEATALVYSPAGDFLWADLNFDLPLGRLLRVTPTGTATLLGMLDHIATGLAFFTPTGGCTYSIAPASASIGAGGGTGTVSIAAGAGCAWTAVSNATFITITSGASGTGNGTASYSVAANAGTSSRTGTLTIAGQTITVTQSGTTTGSTLSVSPAAVSFSGATGAGTMRQAAQVRSSAGTISWTASAALLNGAGWLSISPASGTASANAASILSLEVNFSALAAGLYDAQITVRNTATGATAVVNVSAAVTAAGAAIRLSQSAFVFRAKEGGPAPASQGLRIFNAGSGSLNWSIPGGALPPWLSLTAISGSPPADSSSPVTITTNPAGLIAGVYQILLAVSAAGAVNNPQLLTVTLLVVVASAAAVPDVAPNGMLFVGSSGGVAPGPQAVAISNAGGATLTFSAQATTSSGGNWLSATPTNGSTSAGPAALSVSVDTAGLLPGYFRGKVTVSYSTGTPLELDVLLVVAPVGAFLQRDLPGAAACAPSAIDMYVSSVGNGLALPVSFPRTLQVQVVDNCGGNVSNATVVANIGTLSIVLPGVGGGLYSGNWTPESASGSVSATFTATHPSLGTAQRSLTVSTGAAPAGTALPILAPNGVVEGAGFTSLRPLAPGSIVSAFAAPGSAFASGDNFVTHVPLDRSLGGVSVRIGGEDAPLYYAGPTQVNAQVPFTVRPGESVSVVVNAGGRLTAPQNYLVAPNQPGIFQSAGTAAVLASNFSQISAANPARIGDTIQIFANGLGLVDQTVATGNLSPPFSNLLSPVTVTVGGVQVPVQYQGLAPGFVGLYQVNVLLTSNVPTGDGKPIVITQNGLVSNPNLAVSIPIR